MSSPTSVETAGNRTLGGSGPGAVLDRSLYALFGRHADARRHDADRQSYRGTDVRASFDVYISRVYALSWIAFVGVFVTSLALAVSVVPTATGTGLSVASGLTPGVSPVAAGSALVAAAASKRVTIWFGGRYLQWIASARQTDIDRTLPGAVRYLRVLSTGSDDRRAMLRKVAANTEAYGQTAVAFRKALNKATLTGSLSHGLQIVARDTPSRDVLAPFLLKFREHAEQGGEELTSYLRMESRMLSHQQGRARERAESFLELLAELFIVLLVLPSLMVIITTVLSVLSPSLSQPIGSPVGTVTGRQLIVYGSAVFVLSTGLAAAWLVERLRPPDHSEPSYEVPAGVLPTITSAARNPASAVVLSLPIGLGVGASLSSIGVQFVDVVLLSYVAFTVPVGLVAVRRARINDAKDREIKDFVHAVSGHVRLGRPFSEAVERVAADVDLGALQADVDDLAFNVNLTTTEGDLRAAALDRFVERVGTPLAGQTIGLVTGALDAGGDTEDIFETLQTEVGRLHHEKKALRSAMLVYVTVGWTTALLVIGIVVAVDAYVIDGFAQLSAVSGSSAGVGLDPSGIDPARERYRFYIVTQATMLASGWFAGTASRGRYEALLHSGVLVLIAYAVFSVGGMV
ncbi:Archaellum biogenesis protein FlaJ, TadC family [Natronoarchaeum philippinense]|uniref:Archaellum biogenesis protein FlaJ, TadC family n=1 Tax=Natronoarchaeum philippinense TaxID=558529 RepID=A0A285NUC6_NATPI|nr:type II secretion system F family protein [Natronoarchaeum philippinense]SNZ12637.1 Archaellum biogenesis protein FlaJ, TadC family [Natronoarchaeum philippinense]